MKSLIAAVGFASLSLATAPIALAENWIASAYSDSALEAAQAADKPIVLEFYASWCTVCIRQERALHAISETRPDLVVLQVDFDGDRETVKKFGVSTQGTLIAFDGAEEKGRLIGRWKEKHISAFLDENL